MAIKFIVYRLRGYKLETVHDDEENARKMADGLTRETGELYKVGDEQWVTRNWKLLSR